MDTRTPTAYSLTTISLHALYFGHEHPGGSINVRTPTPVDAERMAASIAAEGLLQPLLVVPGQNGYSGRFFVVIGGRRLAGLKLLLASGTLGPDTPIPCNVAPDLGTADLLAKSLIAEESHLPPHPVDRFESFAQLRRLDVSIPDIAARHLLDERAVRQCLALGDLHSEVRNAWRQGEISGEVARLFTLADDPAQQIKTLDRLRVKFGPKLREIGPEIVRKLFAASEAQARRLLKFVGTDTYRGDGGRLTEDLFAGTDAEPSHIVHDVAKLKKLATDKLDAEAKRLVAVDGWQWADVTLDEPDAGPLLRIEVKPKLDKDESNAVAVLFKQIRDLDRQTSEATPDTAPDEIERLADERGELADQIDRIQHLAALRSYTPEQRAKAGCLVGIGEDGALALDHGLVKPTQKLDPPPEAKIVDKLSPAAREIIADVKTKSLGQAVACKPKVALAIALASAGVARAPLTILSTGVPSKFTFDEGFEHGLKMPEDELLDAFAVFIGTALDFASCEPSDTNAILAAVDAATYQKSALSLLERKRFLAGCSTDYLLDVIEEAFGADTRASHADKSQKQLAAICLDSLAKHWLPKELRTPETKVATQPAKKVPRK